MRAVRFDIQDIAEANPRGYTGNKIRSSLEVKYTKEILAEAYSHIRRQYPIASKTSFTTPSSRITGFMVDGEELVLPWVVEDLKPRKLTLTIYLSDEDVELHNEIASLVPEPANK